MPFKLRLKKSRQYNVVSKSLFVICVELLDGTTIECTLSSESLGKECLDNVCQRLGLQQPEFFGLRYVNRHGAPRWLDMERTVKKQLDKYAKEPNLYLRVMYYVTGVSLITDEMTRYHYFLQLKKDVIEGRISCNLKQASMLASYSMQAEFGNHDLERHTAEYLKDFALFPKHLVEEGHLERLTKTVILQHAELAGLPQGTAEEYYILAAQQLDGYGQETFYAKDDMGNEVIIAVALNGIHVLDNNAPKIYRWKDITNVVNHKRNFGMELQDQADPIQFQLPDIETAKYIWRMCVHQHTFFVQYETATTDNGNTAQIVSNLFSQLGSEDGQVGSSHEELDRVEPPPRREMVHVDRQRAQSTSCLDLASHTTRIEIDRLRAMLPIYRPAPDYETALQHKYRGHAVLYSSQPEIHQSNLHEGVRSYGNAYKQLAEVGRLDRVYMEQHQTEEDRRPRNITTLHTYRSSPDLELEGGGGERGVVVQLYKPPPPYRPNSNSTPDLASQPSFHTNPGPRPRHTSPFITNQVSGSSPDLVCLRSAGGAPYILANPQTHRTYANLAALADTKHLDEVSNNNIVYLVAPGANTVIHQGSGQPQPTLRHSQFSQRQEPIYENVPLTWVGGEGEPRSRAASIQSAPEMRGVEEGGSQASKPPPPSLSQSSPSPPSHTRFNISTDSSTTRSSDGSTGGTLGKTGKSKGRIWSNLLGSGGKAKQHNSHSHSHSHSLPKQTDSIRIPLPVTISKEAMCQLLEKKLTDSTLFFEFEKIPKHKNNRDFTTASLSENIPRNRFNDVLPYEETRVRLSPSKENRYGYINASHITVTVGSQQRFYIAAQSPLSCTVAAFWQMVWECQVYLVVSLPNPGEEVAPYLATPERVLHAGHFEIMCQFSQSTGHCATSKLRLLHVESKSSRGIWHLQYTEWGHQGCPNTVPHFIGFLEELSSVRQHTMTEIPLGHNRNPPVMIHCSTGVGPTAVTMLSDLLLFTVDHNQELDIARSVYLLRQQRMLMIQNISQYRFIHSLLIYYLKNSRLI